MFEGTVKLPTDATWGSACQYIHLGVIDAGYRDRAGVGLGGAGMISGKKEAWYECQGSGWEKGIVGEVQPEAIGCGLISDRKYTELRHLCPQGGV